MASLLLIAMGYGFIVWRAHLYLKGKPLGRRAQLSMSVKNGRVHFRSTPHELP